ncbi:peptidoglycan binding domain-containing protein [Streptomyces sp. NA02950]|uniref:peptidoglycan binding domain-containing protein n=1 Tax=Streptomyces sp. NA02950 TaxID=2742137 RepID=UPI0015903136|nr:peptidoglycan binding domain-containing protein [Streptomyces sp. NA02950]QKV92733.1 peptidoglycan binding domain-containing protein [Streptomyces sp. NA02950]
MSRESDSSSSGPRGGSGGAAYPSGTPPYGSRQSPSLNRTQEAPQGASGEGEARAAAKPEEPKTETTLTTRIRINIPGSRPIPPVVMRTPVGEDGVPAPRSGEDDSPNERTGAVPRPEAAAAPEAAPAETGADGPDGRGAKGDGERTSDWFAPRKSKGNASTGNTPRPPAGPETTQAFPAPPGPEITQGFPVPPGPETTQGFPVPPGPETTPGFPAPSGPETTQGFPAPPIGGAPTADLPYFTDAPAGGGFPGDPEPNGATTGPATGDMLMPPGLGGGPHDDELPPPPGGHLPGPFDSDQRTPPGGVGPLGHGGPGAQPPTPPGGSPLSGSLGATTGTGPLGGLGGEPDTDRPLFRDPDPTPGGGVPPEQISSDTLVSGVPVVPPAESLPPSPPVGGGPAAPAGDSGPPSTPAPSAPAAGKPKKKGRSKLVMLVALLVVVGGGAYSAGLVMNHADVPNGTTVLGVDIGGTSKEAAVEKLDSELGNRTTAPLKVSVDGEQKEIKPSVAGLALDTETTVRNVAGRDYNPLTVIGSLFGGTHEAEPEVTVDEEKLRDALERLAGTSGTAREGTINFTSGRAVPVYGKAGKALDVDRAVAAVSDAYRERAETGKDKVIKLPVSVKQPTVSKAEVDNKMKTFAKPAMSGLVTVQTDPQHSLPLSPGRSLPKILSMRVVNGKLVEHYDLAVLKQLYGSTFDGVLIERGTGAKRPVSPQDVVVALSKALVGKSASERIGVIDTTPN